MSNRIQQSSVARLRFRRLWYYLLIGAACVQALHGQTNSDPHAALADLRSDYLEAISKISGLIFRNLTPTEQSVFDQIDIRVPLSDDPTIARALPPRNGVRPIEISVGHIRALEMIVDAAVVREFKGQPRFLQEYIEYILSRWDVNRGRYLQGLSPLRIQNPFEFGHLSDRQADQIREYRGKTSGAAFYNALSFLLAHEVGHHMLGHPGHVPESLADSRSRERDADDWATHILLRNGGNPLAGLYVLVFHFVQTDGGLKGELNSTHPADVRRIKAMYQSVRNDQTGLRYLARSLGVSAQDLAIQIDGQIANVDSEMHR
jgi:hypothetical protein